MSRRDRLPAVSLGSALLALSFLGYSPLEADPIDVVDSQTGYLGTIWDDDIFGLPSVGVQASADAQQADFDISIGSGYFEGWTAASARSTGVDALTGDDVVNLSSTVTSGAGANATGADVVLTLFGTASGDVGVTASARAGGLDGGGDDDEINTSEAVSATSSAQASGVAVGLTVDGSLTGDATTDSPVLHAATTSVVESVAVDGGTGADDIVNSGNLTATSAAGTTSVAGGISIAVANTGNIVAGAGLNDASTLTEAIATGIAGSDGNDTLKSLAGQITAGAMADATAVSVSLAISGTVTGDVTAQPTLSDSSTMAATWATGLSGGEGQDTIVNWSPVLGMALSDATAVGVSVGITLANEGSVSGMALSDASVDAGAVTVGIDAGAGGGTITNSGALRLTSGAEATGVAVGLTIAGNVSYQQGEDTGGDGDEQPQPAAVDDDGGDDAPSTVSGQALSKATTTAAATTVGIRGGDGDDIIVNSGTFVALFDPRYPTGTVPIPNAESHAVGVAASLNLAAGVGINTDAKLDVAGAAVSDVKVTASALAAVIEGGAGNDAITNQAAIDRLWADATATGVAAALNISGSLAYKGGVSGALGGEAVSDASTLAEAKAVALGGGDGDDLVVNEAVLGEVKATADAVAVAAALGVTAGLAIEGDATDVEVSGRAVSDASVTSRAMAIGLDGGAGSDDVQNTAGIGSILAESDATGVAASLNIAGAFSYKGDTESNVSGQAISNTSVNSQALAAAISAGDDFDVIKNDATIASVIARANAVGVAAALSVDVSVTIEGDAKAKVEGGALSNGSVVADATTIGVGVGAGDDRVFNAGDFSWLESAADTVGVAAGLGVSAVVTVKGDSEADVSGAALSDASALARAATTALSGGEGNDRIENSGILNLLAGADATGIAASLEVAGAVTFKGTQEADVKGSAASDASVTALATAIGIDGGAGVDTIINDGAITVMNGGDVDAYALGVAASLNVAGSLAIKGVETGGAVSGVAASSARVTAEAVGAGIDGGEDADDITNRGAIFILPAAEAIGVSASLNVAGKLTGEVEGSAISESDVSARALATGIAGGTGDDVIKNWGPIELMKQAVPDIDAEATAVSVSLDVTGTLNGDAKGEALAKATTTAQAAAVGIDGGVGVDEIHNYGQIQADVGAEADAVSVGASVVITGATGGSATGAALTDASALAKAAATGVHGGADHDIVHNTGAIDLTTDADAAATAVSVSLAGSVVGEAAGKALADGSATALSRSVGIDGGLGGDDITSSLQPITTLAQSRADSLSVSVTVGLAVGLAEGASVADASANSDAYAAAIDGGAGVDTINNASEITSSAAAGAAATSTSVAVTFGVGDVDSVGSGSSSANATATAAGIDGGDDRDIITNSGRIEVGGVGVLPMATANSGSTSVGVTVAVGNLVGTVSSESAARSLASAYGISGGAGDDRILNSGSITAGLRPPEDLSSLMALATAGSDSVNVAVGIGNSPQTSSANAASIATTTVAGLAGGAGKDYLESMGAIESFASAGAVSGGSATKASLTIGSSSGGATSDATSTSTALAAGIDGGSDDDEILAEGNVTVGAWARTTAASTARDYNILSIGAALQSAIADSSSAALAIARGVFAGAGADRVLVGQLVSPGLGLTELVVTAVSEAVSSARASSVTGFAAGAVDQSSRSAAQTTSQALAVGIDGGAGDDHLRSGAAITAEAEAKASTTGISASNTGFTLGGTTKGESMSDARATMTAEAVGIRGGVATLGVAESDADTILSIAPITVTSTASGSSSSTATASSPVTVFGSAEGKAVADAAAQVLASAVGIDGGADDDAITTLADEVNEGAIDAKAVATASVTSRALADAAVVFGGASTMGVSDASASIAAEAVGIDAGDGDDVITTQGRVSTYSEASGDISATSEVDASVAFGAASSGSMSDASATKRSIAVGIDAGSGRDLIENYGTLTTSAISGGSVTSASRAKSKSFFSGASSRAISAASLEGATEAAGIVGGEGGDTIRNYGVVVSAADATLDVASLSVATAKSTFGDASAATAAAANAIGSAVSLGIGGDGGDDVIESAGSLTATASATTNVKVTSVAIARSTFNDANTFATSSSFGAATALVDGIDGGDGDDAITISGLLTVTADADLTLSSFTLSSDGPAFSDARAIAMTEAYGLAGGSGADTLTNRNEILVSGLPRVLAATRTVGGYVQGRVGIDLGADVRGMDGGTGDDTLVNEGDLGVLVGAAHWLSDLPAGTPDIALTAITLGGYVNADASAVANVYAAGIAGGDGWDSVWNDLAGDIQVAASNFIRMATVEIGANVRADLRTSSAVTVAGIAGEAVDNLGTVGARADSLLQADGAALTVFGLSLNQTGKAAATVYGVQGDALLGGLVDNLGSVTAGATAEVRSIERVTAYFASGGQKLDFVADSIAAGIATGAGDDDVFNLAGGSIDVDAGASGSIQGVTTSYNLFGIGGRTENVVDARLDATALGLDLGSGSNLVGNAGVIDVRARAVPSDPTVVGANECAPACVARAVSDIRLNETSATATATTTALARGIQGVGDDRVINTGDIAVLAEAVATSFAQAGEVEAAQDQSSITSLSGLEDNQFVDASLRGLAETDLLGKRLRFPDELDLDFLADVSSVTQLDVAQSTVDSISSSVKNTFVDASYTGDPIGMRIRFPAVDSDFVSVVIDFNSTTGEFTLADNLPGAVKTDSDYTLQVPNQFTDTGYDGPDPVGMHLRFPSADEDFLSVVTAYDDVNHVFTVQEAIPVDVGVSSGFTLSALTTTVVAFDSATGKLTLGNPLPDGVRKGETYTFSVVSGVTGGNTFVDDTRIGEAIPLGTRVTFPSLSGFSALVTGFDAATGTFTLDNSTPGSLSVYDVYALAIEASDERAGAEAQSFSTGIDLSGGHAAVVNDGSLDVRARAHATTAVNAVIATAAAASVAEARGIRTDLGDDLIENTGAIDVLAEATAAASTGAHSERVLAIGIDSGGGNDTVINRGTIAVTGSVPDDGKSQAAVVGIRTGAGDDRVLAGGTIAAMITSGAGTVLAISTEEGSDHVSLLDGLRTAQDIELGAGDDILLLEWGGNFTGVARADPDLDTFVLGGDEDGTFALAEIGEAARYRGFDAFRKQGLSTWTLTGDAAMDWTVDQGALAIQNTLEGTIQTSATSQGARIDVLPGAGVRSHEDSAAIVLAGGDGVVTNRGHLSSSGPAVRFESASGSANYLINQSDGVVESSGTLAVAGGAGNDNVQNFGAILGSVSLGAGSNSVWNRGQIGGTVSGGAGSDSVTNSGEILGGVSLGAGSNNVSNSGRIGGTVSGGAGNDIVTNAGEIVGGVALGAGNNWVENRGLVGETISGEYGDDYLVNHGDILGGVAFGAGSNWVDNLGLVAGPITGGADEDIVRNFGRIADAVRTGPGNDNVENYGEIIGQAGVAIALDEGDDRLLISAASLITGTADGGSGTDAFVLGGTADAAFDLFQIGSEYVAFELFRKEGASRWNLTGTADGPWTVAGGTLLVNGALLGDVVVEPPGRLGGSGSVGRLTNYGTVAPGNSIGVLSVAGDYLHGAAAILEVEVDGLGNSDRLEVGGKAVLEGGTVQVLPSGAFGIATEYTILAAGGGVAGTFASAVSLASVLDPVLDYEPNRVLLTAIRNDFSFESFAATYNQHAVGRALDANKKAAARGDFKPVMDEFLGLTAPEARAALDAVSGELHATTQDLLMRAGDRFLVSAVNRQISAQQIREGGRGVWLDTFGQFGSIDGDGNASGTDYRTVGLAGGVDVAVAANTRLGLALGYSKSSTDLDRSGAGEADVESYHLGLYGEYEEGPWNVRGAGAYSWHDVEGDRWIRYGRVSRHAQADYDADQFSAYLRAGYSFAGPAESTVEPFAALAYARLDRPRFTESGADSLNLEVAAETMDSLVSTLGVRASWDQQWGKARVRPELRLGWAHQFQDDHPAMTASWVGAPVSAGYRDFTVRGPQISRDSLVVGAGLTAEVGKDTRLFVSYDGVINNERTGHAFLAGVRVTW